jgi:hypothetical protein
LSRLPTSLGKSELPGKSELKRLQQIHPHLIVQKVARIWGFDTHIQSGERERAQTLVSRALHDVNISFQHSMDGFDDLI